jgi:hypothetical protein
MKGCLDRKKQKRRIALHRSVAKEKKKRRLGEKI